MPHIDPAIRCHYRDSAGRRCRLPRERAHPTFCSRHARPARPADPGFGAPGKGAVPVGNVAADLSMELLGPLKDFRTFTSINYTLGRLLILKAADQISARDAATVAYICQLLFQTVPGVRKEMQWSRGHDPDDADLHGVLEATSSLWDDEDAPKVVAAHK
jgi:hypothetical protein